MIIYQLKRSVRASYRNLFVNEINWMCNNQLTSERYSFQEVNITNDYNNSRIGRHAKYNFKWRIYR